MRERAPGRAWPRRVFLARTVKLGAALGLARGAWSCSAEEELPPAVDRLAALVTGTPGARLVGRSYLEQFPGQSGVRALAGAIVAERDAALLPERTLRGLVTSQVREDFSRDRTFRCRGWIFSETEGRLCALAVRRMASRR